MDTVFSSGLDFYLVRLHLNINKISNINEKLKFN